jgi:hypothetical protein
MWAEEKEKAGKPVSSRRKSCVFPRQVGLVLRIEGEKEKREDAKFASSLWFERV